MQRSKRFLAALGSGYGVVLANSVFSLVTIPIALVHLGRDGLGVAATVILINSFGQVLQLGVGPSIARFFVDCMQDGRRERLSSLFRLGILVGCAQAVALSIIALLAVPWLSSVFSIPLSFVAQFQSTLTASLIAVAFGFVFVPVHQLLYAAQRIDLINYISIGTQALGTAALVICLMRNMEVNAYAFAGWVQTLSAASLYVYFAKTLRLFPRLKGCSTDWSSLPRLSQFSGNVMVANLGLQLIAISPALVINRILGAASMGDWTVGTRLIQLGAQLTARIPNAAEPTLWEMFSRGDKRQCAVRLRQTAQLAATTGILTGGIVMSANGNFVSLWSSGKVTWSLMNDIMGAGIITISAVASTWCMLPGITKRLGRMRYIYPAEGLLILGLLCAPWIVTNLAVVLFGMLISIVTIRMSYGVNRVTSDLDESVRSLLNSLRGPIFFGMIILPTSLMVRAALENNTSWLYLIGTIVISLIAYTGLSYTIALPQELKQHIRKIVVSNNYRIRGK